MGFNRVLFGSARVAIAGLIVIIVACARPRPYAAESNHPLAEGEEDLKPVLSEDEQARALAAMRDAAGEHEVIQRAAPAPPPSRMRWSDIHLAVPAACRQIEAAVMDATEEDGVYIARLRTVENWPGRLVVRHLPQPDVYEIVELTIGRFPDKPDRIARADALRAALRRQMLAFGTRRRFDDSADDHP